MCRSVPVTRRSVPPRPRPLVSMSTPTGSKGWSKVSPAGSHHRERLGSPLRPDTHHSPHPPPDPTPLAGPHLDLEPGQAVLARGLAHARRGVQGPMEAVDEAGGIGRL